MVICSEGIASVLTKVQTKNLPHTSVDRVNIISASLVWPVIGMEESGGKIGFILIFQQVGNTTLQ
jgi:hypothetical protein